jgi:predicted RNase H-like HicB family nuclease
MDFEREEDFRDIGAVMKSRFTLEYWRDGAFYVGRLLEVPGVFSQGETMDELQENIQDAYDLMVTQERPLAPPSANQQPVELEV